MGLDIIHFLHCYYLDSVPVLLSATPQWRQVCRSPDSHASDINCEEQPRVLGSGVGHCKWAVWRSGLQPNRIMLSLCLVVQSRAKGGKCLDWSQLWVPVLFVFLTHVQTAGFLPLSQMQQWSDPLQCPTSYSCSDPTLSAICFHTWLHSCYLSFISCSEHLAYWLWI